MLSVNRLPGVFGVEISGLDLSKPLDGDTQRELLDRATTPGTRRMLWRVSVTGEAPIYSGATG